MQQAMGLTSRQLQLRAAVDTWQPWKLQPADARTQLYDRSVALAAAGPPGPSSPAIAAGHKDGPAAATSHRQPALEAEQLLGTEARSKLAVSKADDAAETQLAGTSGAIESTADGAAPGRDTAVTDRERLPESAPAAPATASGGRPAAGDGRPAAKTGDVVRLIAPEESPSAAANAHIAAVSLQHGAGRDYSVSAGIPATTIVPQAHGGAPAATRVLVPPGAPTPDAEAAALSGDHAGGASQSLRVVFVRSVMWARVTRC